MKLINFRGVCGRVTINYEVTLYVSRTHKCLFIFVADHLFGHKDFLHYSFIEIRQANVGDTFPFRTR